MLATTPLSSQWSFTLLDTRIEFRSMFVATLFLFIFLCLAYLSNPSETSFRSYLTEQSFRHHLSRLDDPADFDSPDRDDSNRSSSSSQSSSTFGSLESGTSAFHFSNRAAVALRTPRHAFHSFGLFTIAAVIPSHKTLPLSRDTPSAVSSARNSTGTPDHDLFPLKETWFVGAFGKWWRGGVVDPVWPPRHPPQLKCSEGGWSSGILNIKALDRLEDYSGLPFPTTTHSPRSIQRSAPPKLRSRDRSASCLRRSPTPPPLPQSAVLPLHAPKHSQSLTVPQPPQRSSPAHGPPSSGNCPTANGSSPNFDSTPAVAELTQKINQTRALNLELRNQLSEHTDAATAADAALSTELSGIREAKRVEDVSRGELKARTKTLEDGKRAAEAGKRDAERRLRATQKAKIDAGTRIEKLAEEIRALEAQVQEDQTAVEAAGEAAAQEDLEIRAQVKRHKREVRVAEEVVTALNVRVRELEESVERERIALATARENAEVLQREQQNHKHNLILKKPQDTWDGIVTSKHSPATSVPDSGIGCESLDPFPTALEKGSDRDRDRRSSGTFSSHSSPHLHSPGVILPVSVGFGAASQLPVGTPEALARRAKGYSIFDEDLATLPNPALSSKFLPFRDSDADANVHHELTLLPNGLNQTTDGAPASGTVRERGITDELLSKSFQSDNDAFLERDWCRRLSIPDSTSAVGSSGLSHVFPHVGDESAEAFDLYGMRPPRHRLTSDPMDAQRVWPSRTNSELHTSPINVVPPPEARTRWWWPGADKERRSTTDGTEQRKGLNPDAKVFNFSRKPLLGVPPVAPLDSLNPSASSRQVSANANSNGGDGAGATATAAGGSASGFLSGLAMRAFVPSPEEREALQRALGGSSNASLERLPSLSEVGNIPNSPVPNHEQTHATVPSNPLGLPWIDVNPGASTRRSWLRDLGVSVPRPGKIRFSPWGDGDGEGIEADK
ncbi:hypothetical protein EDB83DRAFT_2459542 [Lactarius deliciosus]|nr:hypothetical protein EDB83DRAFT_2459542 [Lactarius deliciosus]